MMHDDPDSDSGMNFPYKVKELIAAIKINRAKHQLIYEKAQVAYIKKLRETMIAKLHALDAGETFDHITNLRRPEEHLLHYDRALDMLTRTTAKIKVISQELFNQLVRDEWSWSGSFASNSKSYASLPEEGVAQAFPPVQQEVGSSLQGLSRKVSAKRNAPMHNYRLRGGSVLTVPNKKRR
jgi:hypothetical protein